jgi:hypothetical protein
LPGVYLRTKKQKIEEPAIMNRWKRGFILGATSPGGDSGSPSQSKKITQKQ